MNVHQQNTSIQDSHINIQPTKSRYELPLMQTMASIDQVIVPAEESVPQDRLSSLPNEILLAISSHLPTWIDSLNFSKASKRYHDPLLCQLYKESDWYPFYIAVQSGNIATLDRCHEFGVPVDRPFELMRYDGYDGTRPLIFAIRHYQPAVVEWLLDHNADPSDPDIFQVAPSRWEALSPLEIARGLHESTMIPEEEVLDSDDIISDDSDDSIAGDFDDSISDYVDDSILDGFDSISDDSDDDISDDYDDGISDDFDVSISDDLDDSGSGASTPPRRWFRVSRVVERSEIIAILERAGSRDHPLELMIASLEAE